VTSSHDEFFSTDATPQVAELPQPGPVPALPPLAVSELTARKANLIAALRVYLPRLSDIEAIDQEQFLSSIGARPAEDGAP